MSALEAKTCWQARFWYYSQFEFPHLRAESLPKREFGRQNVMLSQRPKYVPLSDVEHRAQMAQERVFGGYGDNRKNIKATTPPPTARQSATTSQPIVVRQPPPTEYTGMKIDFDFIGAVRFGLGIGLGLALSSAALIIALRIFGRTFIAMLLELPW